MRPTLLAGCAFAASAAEARFRIAGPPQVAREARVVALDAGAVDVLCRLAAQPWGRARFLECPAGSGPNGALADLVLRTLDGTPVRLSEELADADFVMMIATSGRGAAAASVIGNACTLRGIMTAGVILGESSSAAVSALRPHARVLLVSTDELDAAEVLSAVGA